MTNKLDSICVNHLKTMREAYIYDEELKCRNCSGTDLRCENYKPYSDYKFISPVKTGRLAYLIGDI